MATPTSPRTPLTRARFFLAQAEALPGNERVPFDNCLQAAIVFGRSVWHYLKRLADAPGADPAYRAWFAATSASMKADPVLEYFRESRDLLLKERSLPVARRVMRTASVQAYISEYAEVRVIRSRPWYRRGVRILWQDARANVRRLLGRWQYRAVESLKRRRRTLRERAEAWRSRWRSRRLVPTVREYYLDDPEGLDRPAVDLVRVYLDRLEVIVRDAEAKFPRVVD